MKSRPRIKFLQLPHSVARRIESLTNRTAAALLSLLCRKTIGFGQGAIDLSYKQISSELKIHPRTITRAAKILENFGDIIRMRVDRQIYRWRVVLNQDEILDDPTQTYTTKEPKTDQSVLTERSGPCRQNDQDHADRTIRTPEPPLEQRKEDKFELPDTKTEQNEEPLKILIKDKDLKKQQQHSANSDKTGSQNKTSRPSEPAVHRTDDEPLYKSCLKALLSHGVSRRMARKLCRENDHNLIKDVLDTVPQLAGVENLAGYLVTAIRDGGYKMDKKNAPQVTGGRSTSQRRYGAEGVVYAHLTDHNVNSHRNKTVKDKTGIDAPITYRSVEETRTEQQALEAEKLEQEQNYQQQGRLLAARFKKLSQDLQLQLKLVASVHLSKLVPTSEKREKMLRDKTFRRMANRTVIERFFEWVDEGLDESQALQRLENKAAA